MLLTGFQSYGGREINPTEEIVRALDGTFIAGQRVIGCILPVNNSEVELRITDLINEKKPIAVLCLGLWPGEPMIRIERVAVNSSDFEIPDISGALIHGPVIKSGTDAYLSTLPIGNIQKKILAAGIPARLSGTAGNFLCNALMYHALRKCSELTTSTLCGFIHVPYLPKQVSEIVSETRGSAQLELHQRSDLASMDLKTMVKAIRIAIETTLTVNKQ